MPRLAGGTALYGNRPLMNRSEASGATTAAPVDRLSQTVRPLSSVSNVVAGRKERQDNFAPALTVSLL